jgi:hypothetical protein
MREGCRDAHAYASRTKVLQGMRGFCGRGRRCQVNRTERLARTMCSLLLVWQLYVAAHAGNDGNYVQGCYHMLGAILLHLLSVLRLEVKSSC